MPEQVNYHLVDNGQLRICDHSSLITTGQLNDGLAYWNNGLGATLLANDTECSNFGVELIDVPNGECGYRPNGECGYRPNGDPVGACAELPSLDSPQVRELRVTTFLPNESSASDDIFFPFVVAHELGHNMGFAHVLNPPSCAYSIMNEPRCDPNFPTALTQVDKDNYHNGYHPDPVTNLQAVGSTHTVDLAWDADHIHNERAYLINWLNPCTGQWQIFATAGKNEEDARLDDVKRGGQQQFQILPLTFADPQHPAGTPVNTTVTVDAFLDPPAGMSSTFSTITTNHLEWLPSESATYYRVLTDFIWFGVFFPECSQPIDGTTQDVTIPGGGAALHLAPFYRRVMACTPPPTDFCSAPSAAFTLTERFDKDDWDYAFTYHRSLDDIHLEFINFNPGGMALQLDILDGNTWADAKRAESNCANYGQIESMDAFSAVLFSSGKLATRARDVIDPATCATTFPSPVDVGSGQIPPFASACCDPPATPGPIGGLARPPAVDHGPGGGSPAGALAAAAGIALLLTAGGLYAWRHRAASR